MTDAAFQLARKRVYLDDYLMLYEDLLLQYDWNDPNHYFWVATAPRHEILDWAETVRAGEDQQALDQEP